jgi:hypothetical protein
MVQRSGLGDSTDLNNWVSDTLPVDPAIYGTLSQISYPVSNPISVNTGSDSGSGINWNNIMPGLFGSVEKIAVQTTQQPGYQTTGPNGQSTSYVLAPGQSASGILNIPGTSVASGSNIVIYGLIGIAALYALSKLAK